MNDNRIEVERVFMPENLHICLLGVGVGVRKNCESLRNEIIMVLKVVSIVHGIFGCSVSYSSPGFKQKTCQEMFIWFCQGSS